MEQCPKCNIPCQNKRCPHWKRDSNGEIVKTKEGEKVFNELFT